MVPQACHARRRGGEPRRSGQAGGPGCGRVVGLAHHRAPRPRPAHTAAPGCGCGAGRARLVGGVGSVRRQGWPVRGADLAADDAAHGVLDAAGVGVLSEESGLVRADADAVVVVDPLRRLHERVARAVVVGHEPVRGRRGGPARCGGGGPDLRDPLRGGPGRGSALRSARRSCRAERSSLVGRWSGCRGCRRVRWAATVPGAGARGARPVRGGRRAVRRLGRLQRRRARGVGLPRRAADLPGGGSDGGRRPGARPCGARPRGRDARRSPPGRPPCSRRCSRNAVRHSPAQPPTCPSRLPGVRATLHRVVLRGFRRLPRRVRRLIVRFGTPNYTVGAICLVEDDDGRLLLVRQAYRGAWGAPGGLLKRGEGALTGMRREVREKWDRRGGQGGAHCGGGSRTATG